MYFMHVQTADIEELMTHKVRNYTQEMHNVMAY